MFATPPGTTVAWAPVDLPVPAEELAAFSYVVVEEVVGRLALLRRWAWPAVDQLGRLIWLEDSEYDSAAAAVTIELLRAQLYTPNKLRRRPRCGDTFAARGVIRSGWETDEEVGDLRELFTGSLYDVTADAREAAKLAYHAALGAVPPAHKVNDQLKAEQARIVHSRAGRPLPALKLTAPPRGLR